MKYLSVIQALVVTMLLFCSCQKGIDDTTIPGQVDTSNLPKTYTEEITSSSAGNSSVTLQLSYDTHGRVTSMISTTNAGDKFIYQYPTDSTFTMDIYNGGSVVIHENFFINKTWQLVDSTFQYNDEGDTITEKYHHDPLGRLSAVYEFSYTTTGGAVETDRSYYTYDSNGNYTSIKGQSTETTYEYDTSLKNVLNRGLLYFYQNKHLPVKTTQSESGETHVATHTYAFDNQNRLTVETISLDNGDAGKRTYTY
ncbi:hypothetical protein [Foetidibacter luteolus]|uniref:hypothetical protein n=1 Tax=Foetidibacter luteolus TaxID=2608880 RepID=UPI00129BAA09|nr:hypothetical protein [Foetidibacter luteolus]